jgi:hypothetical protein
MLCIGSLLPWIKHVILFGPPAIETTSSSASMTSGRRPPASVTMIRRQGGRAARTGFPDSQWLSLPSASLWYLIPGQASVQTGAPSPSIAQQSTLPESVLAHHFAATNNPNPLMICDTLDGQKPRRLKMRKSPWITHCRGLCKISNPENPSID